MHWGWFIAGAVVTLAVEHFKTLYSYGAGLFGKKAG